MDLIEIEEVLTYYYHDRQDGKDHKQGLIRKGIKTAISITKYDVDVLGNYYLSKPEKRLELA